MDKQGNRSSRDVYWKRRRLCSCSYARKILRILKKDEQLQFDVVLVDEAHDLLQKDSRNLLLASTIILLQKRNPDLCFKFLTPFLCDATNLKTRYTNYELLTYNITEYIKSEKFYLCEMKDEFKLSLYDHFK